MLPDDNENAYWMLAVLFVAALLITAFTGCPTASAQQIHVPVPPDGVETHEGVYKLYKLPPWERCQENFVCFDLARAKMLLQLDSDLRWYTQRHNKLFLKSLAQGKSIKAQSDLISLLQEKAEAYKSARDDASERWKKENRLRIEAETRPQFGSLLAWGSTGVLGATVVVLSLFLAVGG